MTQIVTKWHTPMQITTFSLEEQLEIKSLKSESASKIVQHSSVLTVHKEIKFGHYALTQYFLRPRSSLWLYLHKVKSSPWQQKRRKKGNKISEFAWWNGIKSKTILVCNFTVLAVELYVLGLLSSQGHESFQQFLKIII